MGTTTNYGWTYPDDLSSRNLWGSTLNTLFQDVDTQVKSNENRIAVNEAGLADHESRIVVLETPVITEILTWTNITLLNGWLLNGGFARYAKDKFGIVYLDVYQIDGSAATSGTFGALPTLHRPLNNIIAPAHQSGTYANKNIGITSAGSLSFYNNLSTINSVRLPFKAEQ